MQSKKLDRRRDEWNIHLSLDADKNSAGMNIKAHAPEPKSVSGLIASQSPKLMGNGEQGGYNSSDPYLQISCKQLMLYFVRGGMQSETALGSPQVGSLCAVNHWLECKNLVMPLGAPNVRSGCD